MAWLSSGLSLLARSLSYSASLMPRANWLLSYVGRLTIARISPVCGFIAMTTPRVIPTLSMAHLSAFWASRCAFVSIVSVSEAPGTASRIVWRTCVRRPVVVTGHALGAVRAAQLRLVLRFQPDLPQQVIRLVALVAKLRQLFRGHGPGIPEQLGHQGAIGVFPSRLDHDLDPRQLVARLRDELGRLAVDVLCDAHEVERRARVAVDRRVDVGRIHRQQRAQPCHDLVAELVGKVGGPDLHGERRDVGHEQAPIPVVHVAARCDERLLDRALPVRDRGVLGPVGDLQVEQPRRQGADRQHDHEREHQEAREPAFCGWAPVDERVHQSTRSCSMRRSWTATVSGPMIAPSTPS